MTFDAPEIRLAEGGTFCQRLAHNYRSEARQAVQGVFRAMRIHNPGANYRSAEVMPVKQAAEAHLKACELDYLTEVLG